MLDYRFNILYNKRNQYVKDRRRMLKLKAVEHLGGSCQICNYNKCIQALEFHHLDPTQKEFGISDGDLRSWERIKLELTKCILLCSNCHREVHVQN